MTRLLLLSLLSLSAILSGASLAPAASTPPLTNDLVEFQSGSGPGVVSEGSTWASKQIAGNHDAGLRVTAKADCDVFVLAEMKGTGDAWFLMGIREENTLVNRLTTPSKHPHVRNSRVFYLNHQRRMKPGDTILFTSERVSDPAFTKNMTAVANKITVVAVPR